MANLRADLQAICLLLDHVAKYELRSLSYGDLKIEFRNAGQRENFAQSDDEVTTQDGKTTSGQRNVKSNDTEASFVSDEDREQQRLQQLATDDPVAYEQEMIDAASKP